jgi:hypothetical protein
MAVFIASEFARLDGSLRPGAMALFGYSMATKVSHVRESATITQEATEWQPRKDCSHYDDPGGVRVAAYLRAHVPALALLGGR